MPSAQPRAIEALVENLASGRQPADAEISLLSDLDRNEAGQFRAQWTRIPPETREYLLDRAAELAEESVELDFVQLGRIGLDDPEDGVRLRAIETVIESTDRTVAERLRDLAAHDPAEPVRVLSAATLNGFVVMHELGRLDPELGMAIVETLRQVVEDEAQPEELRAAALESLGPLSANWMAELISASYESGDRSRRLAAVRAMGDSADERWLDYLADQFYSDDSEFRFEAVVAAGSIASEESVEPLAALLEDDDPEVVLAAVEALGEIGGQDAVDLLQQFAETAPPGLEELVKTARENAVENSAGSLSLREDEEEDDEDEE